jgi:hypothetical protein
MDTDKKSFRAFEPVANRSLFDGEFQTFDSMYFPFSICVYRCSSAVELNCSRKSLATKANAAIRVDCSVHFDRF